MSPYYVLLLSLLAAALGNSIVNQDQSGVDEVDYNTIKELLSAQESGSSSSSEIDDAEVEEYWDEVMSSLPGIREYLERLDQCVTVVKDLQIIQQSFYYEEGEEEQLEEAQITLCRLAITLDEAFGVLGEEVGESLDSEEEEEEEEEEKRMFSEAENKRAYDSIGLRPIGMKRAYDSIGLRPIGMKRAYDTIGRRPIGMKRAYDTIGRRPIGMKRAYDSIVLGPNGLKRAYDSIGLRPIGMKRSPSSSNVDSGINSDKSKSAEERKELLQKIAAELNSRKGDYKEK